MPRRATRARTRTRAPRARVIRECTDGGEGSGCGTPESKDVSAANGHRCFQESIDGVLVFRSPSSASLFSGVRGTNGAPSGVAADSLRADATRKPRRATKPVDQLRAGVAHATGVVFACWDAAASVMPRCAIVLSRRRGVATARREDPRHGRRRDRRDLRPGAGGSARTPARSPRRSPRARRPRRGPVRAA